jgi:hypothetical protein
VHGVDQLAAINHPGECGLRAEIARALVLLAAIEVVTEGLGRNADDEETLVGHDHARRPQEHRVESEVVRESPGTAAMASREKSVSCMFRGKRTLNRNMSLTIPRRSSRESSRSGRSLLKSKCLDDQ